VFSELKKKCLKESLDSERGFQDCWHSWDSSPWQHPWLTSENLSAAKEFDSKIFRSLIKNYGGESSRKSHYAFVGNLANNMAFRALPMRRSGYEIDLILHPQDRNVMSQPGWELADCAMPPDCANVDQLLAKGIALPHVSRSFTHPMLSQEAIQELVCLAREESTEDWANSNAPAFVRRCDVILWPSFFSFLPLLDALQAYDSIFVAQAPYLAYLANKPYLAAQTGGDLWLDCSRNDGFGHLQRKSYRNATAILATNPWAYSNARRFGFRHVLYAPLIVDTEAYAPGPSGMRKVWQEEIGGDFFALVTARIDRKWKGSHIGLEGFVKFAKHNPQARLVVVGWGEDCSSDIEWLNKNGLEGRYIQLPISGKRKLVEYMKAADCLIDQFAIGYYGATALEAMSTGLPVSMMRYVGRGHLPC
jgi:glycosyltransferase involved in cell wall biosynthesis